MTWSNEALENVIATLESGSRPTGGASIDGGEVLSIGGENILQSGGVTLEDVKRVPVAFFNRMTKGHLRDDDVLINKDGAQTGKVGWYHPGRALVACINEHVFLLRGDPDQITQGYLYYSLLSDLGQAQIRLQISGSAQPGLKTGFTKGVNVDVPADLREQSMIVRVLSTVDRAIEETEALIAKQQHIKTGLLQDLLTRGIDEHGDLRSEQTHEFKDSPLGRIPVEWKVRELQSLLANVSSPMRSGPFGSALLKEELVESGVPLIGIDNVLPERFVPDFRRFVSRKKAVQLHRYRVRPRDLMITIMGTVGRCCVVPEDIGEALSSKHVWTLSLNQDLYSPFLACLQINHSPWVHDHFARDEQGGIMASIRSETLRTTRLPTPPPPEMLRIEQVLRAAAEDLRQIENMMGKVALLKSGLMQDVLKGNRRVTALLERHEGVTT